MAQEILSSELEYMKSLSIIQDVFKKPLQAAVASNRFAFPFLSCFCFCLIVLATYSSVIQKPISVLNRRKLS